MNKPLQMWGLFALTLLAVALLALIAGTFWIIGSHIGPDGRVPSAEAFGLTALLLSFREVVASIRGLYDTEARSNLTDKLAGSVPAVPAPPSQPSPSGDPAPDFTLQPGQTAQAAPDPTP